jgi:hypothetical protein
MYRSHLSLALSVSGTNCHVRGGGGDVGRVRRRRGSYNFMEDCSALLSPLFPRWRRAQKCQISGCASPPRRRRSSPQQQLWRQYRERPSIGVEWLGRMERLVCRASEGVINPRKGRARGSGGGKLRWRDHHQRHGAAQRRERGRGRVRQQMEEEGGRERERSHPSINSDQGESGMDLWKWERIRWRESASSRRESGRREKRGLLSPPPRLLLLEGRGVARGIERASADGALCKCMQIRKHCSLSSLSAVPPTPPAPKNEAGEGNGTNGRFFPMKKFLLEKNLPN